MNINLFNDLSKKVYEHNCAVSFERILVDIDNIIKKAALNTYERYDDKILNEVEDIQQNISIAIYMDFISKSLIFKDEKDIEKYIYKTAEEVLIETRG